jgi:hypothetical protein
MQGENAVQKEMSTKGGPKGSHISSPGGVKVVAGR